MCTGSSKGYPAGRGFVLALLLTFLTCTVLGPTLAADDGGEEFIIEGEYRKPSKSSFEYEGEGVDGSDTGSMGGTEDLPRTGDEAMPEPSLQRELQRGGSGAESEQGTKVEELGSREIISIILGIGVFMAANG